MHAVIFLLKLLLKITFAPIILLLTIFVWICVGIIYISGLILGAVSTILAILGIIIFITGSITNGIIILIMSFLIGPYGLPMASIWLIGNVQKMKYFITEKVYG